MSLSSSLSTCVDGDAPTASCESQSSVHWAQGIDASILPPHAPTPGEGMQQVYLDRVTGGEIEVFLTSGVRLTGQLISHDRYTLVLQGQDGQLQMVYKHALSSLSGARN